MKMFVAGGCARAKATESSLRLYGFRHEALIYTWLLQHFRFASAHVSSDTVMYIGRLVFQ